MESTTGTPLTTNDSGRAHELEVVHSAMGHNLEALWKPPCPRFQKDAIRRLLREV